MDTIPSKDGEFLVIRIYLRQNVLAPNRIRLHFCFRFGCTPLAEFSLVANVSAALRGWLKMLLEMLSCQAPRDVPETPEGPPIGLP